MPVRVRVSPSAPFQNRPEIALQVERGIPIIRVPIDAGWSSLVARRAHNPKVVGSNPAPATILGKPLTRGFLLLRPMIGPGKGKAARSPNVWSLSVNDFFALAHRGRKQLGSRN